MGGVLCAGNMLVDVLTRPVADVRWDATTWVDSIEQCLGGNGANTSYALAKLGARVRLLGIVGDDAFGQYVLGTLRSAGVDTSRIGLSSQPTAATTVLVRPDGARALLHRPGASREAFAEPIEFTADLTDGCTHFHLANPFGLPLLRGHAGETLRRARAAGLMTSLDTGWDARAEWMAVAGPCLEHLDYLFVNRDESRMLAGTEDPDEAARFFRERGVRTVVVKLGAAGCAIFSSHEQFRVAAFRVPVVDTTGAGDCFAGGFLAMQQEGAPAREAARFANAVGALCIQGLGATTGLRSRGETEEWARKTPTLPGTA